MDWPEYQRRCDQPDAWTRWMLEQSAELLRAAGAKALALRVAAVFSEAPLAKPVDHKGPPASDMFVLTLGADEVRAICAHVESAVRANAATSGTQERGLGGFAPAWREYLRWLTRADA